MKNRKNNDLKDEILEDVLTVIASTGDVNISIREMAKQTGRNIAAIHYHFGSKDGLYEQIAEKFIAETMRFHKEIRKNEQNPAVRLENWAVALSNFILSHKGMNMMFAHFMLTGSVHAQKIRLFFYSGNEEILELLSEAIEQNRKKRTTPLNQKEKQYLTMQLMSSICFPLIHQDMFSWIKKYDKDEHLAYIRNVLSNLGV